MANGLSVELHQIINPVLMERKNICQLFVMRAHCDSEFPLLGINIIKLHAQVIHLLVDVQHFLTERFFDHLSLWMLHRPQLCHLVHFLVQGINVRSRFNDSFLV
jgi:hypothetical protein